MPTRFQAYLRHAQHYLHIAQNADRLYAQGGENVLKGLSLFDAEFAHIRSGEAWSGANWATNEEAARVCNNYPIVAMYSLGLRLRARDRIELLENALSAARKLDDRRAELKHLSNLGLANRDLGEMHKAVNYQMRALAIANEIGDKQAEGDAFGNLGLAYANLGEAHTAIEYHEKALAIARSIGDRRGESNRLGNLGSAYRLLGNSEKAIDFNEQALAITREIGDKEGEGNRLGSLGNAYYSKGDFNAAIGYYEQALDIAHEIRDKRSEEVRLGNLGSVYYSLGDVHKAIMYHMRALVIDREIGDRHGEGRDLSSLGYDFDGLGDIAKAIEYLEQAVAVACELKDKVSEHNWLRNLGELLSRDPTRFEEAEAAYRKVLEFNPGEPENYVGIVSLLRRQQREREAIPLLEKRTALDAQNYEPFLILASIHKKLGDAKASQELAGKTRKLIPADEWYALARLGSVSGDVDSALEYLRLAAYQKDFNLVSVWEDPDLEWVRSDTRFAEIVSSGPSR